MEVPATQAQSGGGFWDQAAFHSARQGRVLMVQWASRPKHSATSAPRLRGSRSRGTPATTTFSGNGLAEYTTVSTDAVVSVFAAALGARNMPSTEASETSFRQPASRPTNPSKLVRPPQRPTWLTEGFRTGRNRGMGPKTSGGASGQTHTARTADGRDLLHRLR